MIAAVGFENKTIAVLGLGRTGLSAAKALLAGGAHVIVWDDNKEKCAEATKAGLTCQDLAKRDWADISALVLSPGIPHTHPKPHHVVELARAVGVPILGDTELFALAINAIPLKHRPKVFGITGTNGKSTTTALLTHVLRECGHDAHAGGNIGTPCLDLPPPHPGIVYVLEFSSYQLELTQTLHCNGAILLNLSPDHLDRHGGFAGYEAAKRKIFSNQTKDDIAIISMDDVHSQSICISGMAQGRAHASIVPISAQGTLSHGISYAAGKLYETNASETILRVDLGKAAALKGTHNGQNAAAVFAAARHAGLGVQSIVASMMTFPGLAHRMEAIGTHNGVQFINDSKATNVDAVRQALGSFDTIFWIAGGQAKAGGLEGLDTAFGNVRKVFLIGEAQASFARQLKGKLDVMRCGSLESAVAHAYEEARKSALPDPVVLLSPACASFDQFKDFRARGEAFQLAVNGLEGEYIQKRPA